MLFQVVNELVPFDALNDQGLQVLFVLDKTHIVCDQQFHNLLSIDLLRIVLAS